MPRAHLFSLRIGHAVRESLQEQPYSAQRLIQDLIAGITVGVIAIPLSMALAIASGVAPQYGLYTAIVAGIIIALTGGARYSVSGPTAAFVVILYPVATKFGLGGLLIATMLSGIILIVMALMRLGRYIEYIPQSVTLGFTAGIAIVIATLQLKDFMGLDMVYPETYIAKIEQIILATPHLSSADLIIGLSTLAVLIAWQRISKFPPHIPALVLGTLLALAFSYWGLEVDTIGSRFSYTLSDGSIGMGMPQSLPEFVWPWNQPNAQGEPIGFSWELLQLLMPAAFSIAMLGAIESLLCAVVVDNMTNTHHSANSELLGQGIGNMVAPLFGGITATAAIARSGANVRAGAQTPFAAVFHGLVVLIGLLALAPLLSYLPMASMAAILLLVAWNIAGLKELVQFVQRAPKNDVWVLVSCLSLTVLFDMVIAIGVGVVFAALLFMREISEMTRISDISQVKKLVPDELPNEWAAYKIHGPLFFAAADRVFSELAELARGKKGLILYMDAVTLLDAGGLAALQKFLAAAEKHEAHVLICDLQFQPLKTLARAKIQPKEQLLTFTSTLTEALELTNSLQKTH